jgi:hypothetical protein
MVGPDQGSQDTSDHPHRHVAKEKPPVMAAPILTLGLRFKVHEHVRIKTEFLFRGPFAGSLAVEYIF